MRRVMTAVAMTLVCSLTACGTAHVPAEEWTAEVCGALDPWNTGISELTQKANTAMSGRSSPADAQDDLRELLNGAARLSDTAADRVADAGVPEVEAGEEIAERFEDSLRGTARAYRTAHDDIAALSASKKDFYDEVAAVMERLERDYESVPRVSDLDSEPLRDAFASADDCQ